jgi:hypothetical protein
MAEDHKHRGEIRTTDREVGAPRPSQMGSVPVLGFDDPSLRPLPPEQLDYHIPHPDAHPERHEHSDVPIRPLAISLAAIAITLTVMFIFLHWLFFRYKAQQDAIEWDRKRTNVPAAKPAIQGPRLQGVPGFGDNHPIDDMKDLRAAYEVELNSYGKAGEDGFARVPINRAMDLAIERGMFKTASSGTAPTGDAGKAPPPQSPPRREGVR